jgi:hypothetical protein
MVKHRGCASLKENGQPCGAPRMRDGDHCLMHSPEHAQEAAEVRRLGGLRRRREVTLSGAYDVQGLETVADIRRLLQIAVVDTLSLENSISRSRTLAYLAMAALKTLEVGELESRLAMLEQAVLGKRRMDEKVFDAEPRALDFPSEEAAD